MKNLFLITLLLSSLVGCTRNQSSSDIAQKMGDYFLCAMQINDTKQIPDNVKKVFNEKIAVMKDQITLKVGKACSADERKVLFEVAKCRVMTCEMAKENPSIFQNQASTIMEAVNAACDQEMKSGESKLSDECKSIARSSLITFFPKTPEEIKNLK